MGLAVVIVASGGLPVVESTTGGTPVTEAANGYGVPVTKVVGKPGLPVVFETIGVAPSVPVLTTFATFNGTPSATIVMSNGNLTVTHGSTGNGIGVQSSTALSSGKYYFETTVQVSTSTANAVGLKPFAGGAFSDVGGTFTNGIGLGLGSTNSFIWSNAVNTNKNLGPAAVGNVICIAIDLTNRLAWIRRNGGNWNADVAADPATGINGVSFPAGALAPLVRFTNGTATDAFTGNFGQSAFAFTPPSGFSLGWGT